MFFKKKEVAKPSAKDNLLRTREQLCKLKDVAKDRETDAKMNLDRTLKEYRNATQKAQNEPERNNIKERFYPRLVRYKVALASAHRLCDICDNSLETLRDKMRELEEGVTVSDVEILEVLKGYLKEETKTAEYAQAKAKSPSLGHESARDLDELMGKMTGFGFNETDKSILDEVDALMGNETANAIAVAAKETDDEINKIMKELHENTN